MEISDEQDNLYYLYDVFQYGGPRLKSNLKSCILNYSILPVLIGSLLPQNVNRETVLIGEGPCVLNHKLSLYLILLYLRIFKDKEVANLIANILFGRRIHKELLRRILRDVIIPHSYRREFSTNYFWDKFEFEVDEHC